MASARRYGMKTACTPNRKADMLFQKNAQRKRRMIKAAEMVASRQERKLLDSKKGNGG